MKLRSWARQQQQQQDSVPESSDQLPFLPDNVLVQILAFVPTRELFSARLVCRRWAKLALHPDVWRRRELTEYAGKALCEAVLRLAPCLGALDLGVIPRVAGQSLLRRSGDVLASTRCAAAAFKMDVDDQEEAVSAAAALANQLALGRLRKLRVIAWSRIPGFPTLLRTALAAEGLTELFLNVGDDVQQEWLPEHRPRAASLTKLKCLEDSRLTIVRFLLDCHAASLQTLEFDYTVRARKLLEASPGAEDVPSARWLAGASNLRQLKCPVMADMEALSSLPNLEDLTLGLWGVQGVAAVDGLREYLRGPAAGRLRRLRLRKHENFFSTSARLFLADLTSLAVVLASRSPSSAVEVLELDCLFRVGDESLELLLAALPGLPALRELNLMANFGATLRLLECLSQARTSSPSSPAPLVLCVGDDPATWDEEDDDKDPARCWHSWLHRHQARIARCLRANPALHLRLDVDFRCVSVSRRCSACTRSCHTFRRADGYLPFTAMLYGHPEDQWCEHCDQLDEDTAGVRAYFRVV